MFNGAKIPYEEYVLDKEKMAQLSFEESVEVAKWLTDRFESLARKEKISDDAAYHRIIASYKKMKRENFLPEYYVLESDPNVMLKVQHYASLGIRDVEILADEEYDRRRAFEVAYMMSDNVF